MEAACQGAAQSGGVTVGILPGGSEEETPPNRFVQIPVYTGMGEARNALVVRSSGAVIAIGGGYGTLSEIGFALASRRAVVLLDSWGLTPPQPLADLGAWLHTAGSPQEAVALAVALAGARRPEAPAEGADPAEAADDGVSRNGADPDAAEPTRP